MCCRSDFVFRARARSRSRVTRIHRKVFLSVYTPTVLLGIPAQAVLVLLPLYVLELGGSVASASAVVGLRGLGMMTFDIPAGLLVSRFGDRAIMLFAMLLMGVAYLLYGLADEVRWFYWIAFLNGAGSSTFLLGRMSYITSVCRIRERGRVISMIAGSMRLSAFIGPVAGAGLAEWLGFELTFLIIAGTVLLAYICVAVAAVDDRPIVKAQHWLTIPELMHTHRRIFATAGVAAIVFMLMRAARTVLIPLIGADLALETSAIGFIVSLSALVDVILFYPAGVIMDRYGRRYTAVPSSFMFAGALAALAFPQGFYSLVTVAVALGLANGLSTGIVMTLGTDLAPPGRRGEFLGIWRLLTDLGGASGPLVVSAVVTFAPLYAAALAVGALGAAGGIVIYRFVEETREGAG